MREGQPTGRYYARMFARNAWHIINPDGFAIHDSSPYGDDKPVVFRDEDEALACVERCEALAGAERCNEWLKNEIDSL